MPIRSIRVDDVMVFQYPRSVDDVFELSFSDGINVLIGDNGTGKTALLKMLYAAAKWSHEGPDLKGRDGLAKYFSFHLKDRDLLRDSDCALADSSFSVSDGVHTCSYSLSHPECTHLDGCNGLRIPAVFIPSSGLLTRAKDLLALYQKYGNLPFDQTQIDILVNAALPEAQEIPAHMQPILEKLSKAIGGTVVQKTASSTCGRAMDA